jgi:hypothetical protein
MTALCITARPPGEGPGPEITLRIKAKDKGPWLSANDKITLEFWQAYLYYLQWIT